MVPNPSLGNLGGGTDAEAQAVQLGCLVDHPLIFPGLDFVLRLRQGCQFLLVLVQIWAGDLCVWACVCVGMMGGT